MAAAGTSHEPGEPHIGTPSISAKKELLSVVRDIVASEHRERLLACGRHACEQIDALVLSALRQLPPALRDMPAPKALRLIGAGPQECEPGAGGNGDAGGIGTACAAASASVPPSLGGERWEAPSSLPSGISTAHPQHPLIRCPPQYADAHWACDRCAEHFQGASWHCAACSFDLCESCWKRTSETGNEPAKPKRPRPLVELDSSTADISASVKSLGVSVDPTVIERMEALESKTQDLEEFRQILGVAPNQLEAMHPEQRRVFMKRASDTLERMFERARADVARADVGRADVGGA